MPHNAAWRKENLSSVHWQSDVNNVGVESICLEYSPSKADPFTLIRQEELRQFTKSESFDPFYNGDNTSIGKPLRF